MSFIYRFGAPLVAVLSCALSRNSQQDCAAAALGSAAVSAPFTLMRAWEEKKYKNRGEKKKKKEVLQSEHMDGCFQSSCSSLPTCPPSHQGFSSGISIKQAPAREQPGRVRGEGAMSVCCLAPAPPCPLSPRVGAGSVGRKLCPMAQCSHALYEQGYDPGLSEWCWVERMQ